MNVPLSWLAEYVPLPKDTKVLTDRLTMIGHMLDKQQTSNGETVIDLELRGNRSDLFGLIGIARDVHAAFHKPLTLPKTEKLPLVDTASKLVTVEANDLVERFFAFTLSVKVGPSPEWLQKRLQSYGIPSINNVVDITNYVMIETGEPMHAFDLKSLKGGRLILRRAKNGEQMTTLQGQVLTLTSEDLAVCDEAKPRALTMIGSKDSGVTETTTEILLEAAVYNQANVRRSGRRLKIHTEAGSRHEKLLDPNQVSFALSRAFYLLKTHAAAKPTSKSCDQFIKPRTALRLPLTAEDVEHLSGIIVTKKEIGTILTDLDCAVSENGKNMMVTVPTFRTDITEPVDLVEEISRIHGYEHIPLLPLPGITNVPLSSASMIQEEHIRNVLEKLQLNEVITSTIVENITVTSFAPETAFPATVTLINPPDPAIATLRPSVIPNLAFYTKRLLSNRSERVALYEIGRIYKTLTTKKTAQYEENRVLGLMMTGNIDTQSWNRSPRGLTLFDLKGILESLLEAFDVTYRVSAKAIHPCFDPQLQGVITIFHSKGKEQVVGSFGRLHRTIETTLGVSNIFAAELSLHDLPFQIPTTTGQQLAPPYPPIIEDLSFIVRAETNVGDMLEGLKSVDPLITSIQLFDSYQHNRTIRVTFSNPARTLTTDDIKPIREKIIHLAQQKFKADLLTK